MVQALGNAAGTSGHTYLTWGQLQQAALKLMLDSGESLGRAVSAQWAHLQCQVQWALMWLHGSGLALTLALCVLYMVACFRQSRNKLASRRVL